MAEYIRQTYGEERWEDIRRQAGVEQPSFSVHQVYPENLITRLAKKAQEVSYRLQKIPKMTIDNISLRQRTPLGNDIAIISCILSF